LTDQQRKWVYLIILAVLWGSSFILIKKGLDGLSPLHVGTFRVVTGGLVLIAIGFKKLRHIRRSSWKWLALSGAIGTFFPSILFAYAETEIDSAIASILNSTVPLLALIIGVLFYKSKFQKAQFIGTIIGLLGCVMLILIGANFNSNQNYWFATLPVIASLMYAFNANVIKSHLQNESALGIAAGSFLILILPAVIVLWLTGFFDMTYLSRSEAQSSLIYLLVLALFGTVIAKILFNRLIQISDPVFSTSVTYLIPIVALFWGLLDGESFSFWQLLTGGFILVGVYISNLSKTKSVK
jgi:drug/metabolite transporter (DMT)-like permease